MSGSKPVRLDAAPDRPFRGDPDRIGRDGQRGDAEPLQVGRPGRLVGDVVLGMLRQAGDHRPRERAPAHVGERLGVDHVVGEARPEHLEEVRPALRGGGDERGEVVVAGLGADAVAVPVTGAGVVDADPARGAQRGPQHLARLVEEGVLARVQQPDDLPLGDQDADGAELGDRARHGHLALVVLGQHEAAQRRPEVADDPGRHRGEHGPAVGGEPALAADAYDVRAEREVLDQEVLVAFEPRAGGDVRLDDALLVDSEPVSLAPATASPVRGTRIGAGALLHAAGLHLGAAFHALERRDLGLQLGDRLLQGVVLGQQPFGQGLQLTARQA